MLRGVDGLINHEHRSVEPVTLHLLARGPKFVNVSKHDQRKFEHELPVKASVFSEVQVGQTFVSLQ